MNINETEQQSTPRRITGPTNVNKGFVAQFLEEVNIYESYYVIAGDVMKAHHVSCEGYTVDDVTILPRRPGGWRSDYEDMPGDDNDNDSSDESGQPSKWRCPGRAYIVLRPTHRTQRPTHTHRFVVNGLCDCNSEYSISFTLHREDPLADCVTFDQASGTLTIDVHTSFSIMDRPPPGVVLYEVPIDVTDGVASPFLRDIWETHQQQPVSEGVLHSDVAVPVPLADLLDKQIGEVARSEPVDYHPGSADLVRDLVHPSLFPYIDGESPLSESVHPTLARIQKYNEGMAQAGAVDRWGRQFEKSQYQWLPTVFRTDANGCVTIVGYINNLDRRKYAGLYDSLATLFNLFLPLFEQVYAYVKALRILPDQTERELIDIAYDFSPDFEGAKLRNQSLRVVTKIVDYELREEHDSIDGVLHVEGMSSDHILMTGIYIAHRDDDFQGGDLLFQRTFWDFEGSAIFSGIVQTRHWMAERIVNECRRPLGKLDTPKGRLIVFPNSHVHRLSKMQRGPKHTTGNAHARESTRTAMTRRRVVVFWVVDPERDVITTQDVPRQQGVMSLDRAKQHRLALMHERKQHKDRLNGDRKISLCEH